MKPFRAIAIVLSLMVHASLGYAMLPATYASNSLDVSEAGTGDDAIWVEKGVALEGFSKLGDAMETIQTADVTPIASETPPPLPEVKPVEELRDTITATEGKVDENVVKTIEPPTPEPPKPEVVQAQERPQQVAMVAEKSSSEEKNGQRDLAARNAYDGQIASVLKKARVDRYFKKFGKVKFSFTIGLRGELLSREITASSGSTDVDERVIAALESTAFPPIPPEVSKVPLPYKSYFDFTPHKSSK
jgi:periplasmic protein TonB